MTFEESELQRLIEEIIELLQRYREDPGALEAIQYELKAMYQKIPIYTGIIATLLPTVVRPVALDQVKEGSEVTVLLKDDRTIAGRVASVSPGEIKLTDCKQVERPKSYGELALPVSEVKEIRLLTRGILDKERPT